MALRPVSVAIMVSDRKKAIRWYTTKLGLKLLDDDPDHWTVVGARRGGCQFHLCETEDHRRPSKADRDTGILFLCDGDVRRAYRSLRKKGVTFSQPPIERPWGWVSKFLDPDGNELWLCPAE